MPTGAMSLLLRVINMDKPAGRDVMGNGVFRPGLELSIIDNFRDNIPNQGRHAVWSIQLASKHIGEYKRPTLGVEEQSCRPEVFNLKDALHVLLIF